MQLNMLSCRCFLSALKGISFHYFITIALLLADKKLQKYERLREKKKYVPIIGNIG